MPGYLSIGDFSRATHMTARTLRHYHQVGLLEPAEVDPHTGYRRYSAAAHLSRLEGQLGRAQPAVASLRDLLTASQPGDIPARIELRSMRVNAERYEVRFQPAASSTASTNRPMSPKCSTSTAAWTSTTGR